MPTLPRVLLDATAIPAERGGVGRYVDHLAAALDRLEVPLTIACQRRDEGEFTRLAPGSRTVPVPDGLRSRPARLAWEQTGLPLLTRRVGAQVLHSPHYTMPLASPVPTVVTLHDATFFSDRGVHTGVKGRFFRGWTRLALRRSAVCVVPSQGTADELTRWVGARPGSMMVAHHGVDADIFRPPTDAEVADLRRRLDLGNRDWIAFLGTLEPRKNVPALIRGYVRSFADRPEPPALVLAGGAGWDTEVEPALAQVPAGLQVIRAGRLPIESLPALLGGAVVACYPTLGEGFGLPVLEAMACGAAVLTTTRIPMPEIGGDAVAYTDVDATAIGQALADLIDDHDRRTELAAAGLRRAAEFTWKASAEAHLAAYQRAAAGGR